MERRELISLLPLGAMWASTLPAASASEPTAAGLLPRSYDRFATWLGHARAASLDYLREFGSADTERFIRLLSLWACAMPDPPEPDWQLLPGANARLEMATIAPGRPFVVSAFRMAAGCVLPLHCHPGGGGITVCTAGSLAIQHFELCEGQPAWSQTGAFADVRQVQVAQLVRRQATLFTPTVANLHQFRAGPEGATGVEMAVQWQGSGEFSFLKLAKDHPASDFRGSASERGAWTGMRLEDAYP